MSDNNYQALSLSDFISRYATQDACLRELERRRWPDGFICPHCDGRGGFPLGGRRGFECRACRRQTSITAGTILASSKLALPKLFLSMYLISTNKQGISAKSLSKHLAVSEVTAWHLLHKFRSAMKDRDAGYTIRGFVEADESYVGGLASGPGARGRSTKSKVPVIALVEKRADNLTGYVYLQPVKSISSKTLLHIISQHVAAGTTIRTDGLASYRGLPAHGFTHLPEKSLGGQRACAQFKLVHRQFSNLKSWLLGTHRNTCRRHLDRYVAEYCWRTNRRNRYDKAGRSDNRESTLPERMIQAVAVSHALTWGQVRRECFTKPTVKMEAA